MEKGKINENALWSFIGNIICFLMFNVWLRFYYAFGYIITLILSIRAVKEINERDERGWGLAITNIFISIILIILNLYLGSISK